MVSLSPCGKERRCLRDLKVPLSVPPRVPVLSRGDVVASSPIGGHGLSLCGDSRVDHDDVVACRRRREESAS